MHRRLAPRRCIRKQRNILAQVKGSYYRVLAANKALAVANAARWPQLSANIQLGSNYATTYKTYDISNATINGSQVTTNYIDVGGIQYPVYQPLYTIPSTTTPINDQINQNLRQTYALSLTIPLFNGWQAQSSIRQARIQVQTQQLNQYQTELKLKQDVYKAYNDAHNSLSKYFAAQRAAHAAGRAYDFAKARYDIGLTNAVDYLVTQNNQYRAEASVISARYDLIFRLKVIDYYLGKELKL